MLHVLYFLLISGDYLLPSCYDFHELMDYSNLRG